LFAQLLAKGVPNLFLGTILAFIRVKGSRESPENAKHAFKNKTLT
jgi:hypothetical protein